jgi:hypothetical protein
MRNPRTKFLAIVALAFFSSAAAQTPPKLDLKAPPSPAIWRIEPEALTHLASGLRCPATVGDLQRVGVLVYDQVGLNVSCNYAGPGMIATVYAVASELADKDYEASKAGIEARKDMQPKLIAQDRLSRGGLNWKRAAYSFRNSQISEVWVAQAPHWIVKYRLTYAGAEPAPEPAPVKPLTDLVGASMAPTSVACAKTPPAVREGKITNDMKAFVKGSAAGAYLEAAMTLKPPPSGPPRFCADGLGQINGVQVVLLRGVGPDGGEAYVDRVSQAGSDIVLTSRWNPALGRDGENDPNNAGPFWTVTAWDGAKVKSYGVFDGRPDLKMLSVLLAGVSSHQMPALHTFDPATSRIEGLGAKSD